MDTNNPFAEEVSSTLSSIPQNDTMADSATLALSQDEDAMIEEILSEKEGSLDAKEAENGMVANTTDILSLAQLTKSLKRKREDSALGSSVAVDPAPPKKKHALSADATSSAAPSTNPTTSRGNVVVFKSFIMQKTDTNELELVEDSRTLNMDSIRALPQNIVNAESSLTIKPQTSVRITQPMKCFLNTNRYNRKIASLELSVHEGFLFEVQLTPTSTTTIHIPPDYLREHLKDVVFGLNPVVVVLEFDVLEQLKSFLGGQIPRDTPYHRIFMRLTPESYPDEDLRRWVQILKTILEGPTQRDSTSTPAPRAKYSVRFTAVHNRYIVHLAKGNANNLKQARHIEQNKVDPHKRPVFEMGKLVVTMGDVNRLHPEQFLNDNIIDYYLREIYESLPEEMQERCYFFNSQFYPLASVKGKSKDAERTAKRIPPPREVQIFKKDFVFVPVCHQLHWTLCIVCYPRNAGEEADEQARIEYCDSLGGMHEDAINNIRKYLRNRWKVEHPDAKPKAFIPQHLPVNRAVLPRQNNNSDCGVFMLHYVEKFVQIIPELPLREADWFTTRDITQKRLDIMQRARERHRTFQLESHGTTELLF